MSSTFWLSSIPERVLSDILAYSGTLALHEVIMTGDRLLLAKLSSPECIIQYRATDEFGKNICWSKYALTHLKGIRSIRLFTSGSSLEILERTLSWTATPDLQSLTIETPIEPVSGLFDYEQLLHQAPPALNVNLSQFTQLEEFHRNYVGLKDADFCCLQNHLSIPSHLKALTLGLDINYTGEELLSLPQTLESLVISTSEIHRIDWLAALSNLKKLTIHTLGTWRLLDSEFAEISAVSRLLPLQELILPSFEIFQCETRPVSQEQESAFFGTLRNLVCLKMPHYAAGGQVWGMLSKLTILHCALDRTNYTTHLPPQLVELKTRISISTSFMSNLATSLRVLDDAAMVLTSDLAKLLPRHLEVLSTGNIYGSQAQIFSELPQTLRSLRIGFLNVWAFGPLLQLPASLKVLELSTKMYVRTKRLLSAEDSGWTHFPHALSVTDLEAMEQLIHLSPTMRWQTSALTTAEPTVEALTWLWNRGLLAHPPAIQRLNHTDFIRHALSHYKSEQVHAWIIQRLTPQVWTTVFKTNRDGYQTSSLVPGETYRNNATFYQKNGFQAPTNPV